MILVLTVSVPRAAVSPIRGDRGGCGRSPARGASRRCTWSGSSSFRRRPSRMSFSSTAPRRPSKVVKTGVPSATASRFMVPPAEITRSDSAIRLCASIARSGHDQAADRLYLLPLSGRSRQHHGLGGALQAIEHGAEQGVLEAVVERHLGRGAHHHDRPLAGPGPARRAPRRRARSRRGSTPPSGPRRGGSCPSRRSAPGARAGSRRGTTTARARRQFTLCWAVAHS